MSSLTIEVQGRVVRRQVVNRVLGFFDIHDASGGDHPMQVRIKSSELTNKHMEGTVITYSDARDGGDAWRVKDITVGAFLMVKGVMEVTPRGTSRLSATWVQIYTEPPTNLPRHTTSLADQSCDNDRMESVPICRDWARKLYHDQWVLDHPDDRNQKHIAHWLLGCSLSDCTFRHGWESEEQKKSYLSHLDKQQERLEQEYDPNDPFRNDDVASKTYRAHLFADWIASRVEAEGWKDLHIIDVAGGRGVLLRELLLRLHQRTRHCTLVEPDTRKMTPESLLCEVRHRGKLGEDIPLPEVDFLHSWFTSSFFQDAENRHLFDHSHPTLLIGLHPDQATEAIVQGALYWNISVAVVPCCVFPDEFPHRQILTETGDSVAVRQYSEFIRYLETLCHPPLQSDYLPIQGRNRILFQFVSTIKD